MRPSPDPRKPTLPFKLNQDRRHHIPKQKHKVANWAEYDASLRQRGSLTVWFTDEAIAAWHRAAHHAGRATALLGSGDHDGADPQGRVPLGAAPDRRPDRLPHRPAWSRSLCSRPHHPEPAGRNGGRAAAAATQPRGWGRGRALAPVGGQHGPQAVWTRRMADRETRDQDAPILAQICMGRSVSSPECCSRILTDFTSLSIHCATNLYAVAPCGSEP